MRSIIGVSAPMDIEKSRLEDILGRDTYGFVSVDSQHSPYSEERLVAFLRHGGGDWHTRAIPH